MNIGTVVEGPTDRLVLEAVLCALLPVEPEEHRFFALQPNSTLGETGAGWKGVRRWCRQISQSPAAGLEFLLSGAAGPPLDLLVIHVDADIAGESDLQEGVAVPIDGVVQPCPPASATAEQLRHVLEAWLNLDELPRQVVLAIPAQDMETWTFAALFPQAALCQQADYECLGRGSKSHPAFLLSLRQYGAHLRRKDGSIKKPVNVYRRLAPRIVCNWAGVCRICTQAERFSQDVVAAGR